MKAGYIPGTDQPVQWIPDGKKKSVFKFSVAYDGIALSDKGIHITGYTADAFFCQKCGIVIVPVKK